MLDAGMVATEMLYYLVGSRELDGGAMVTASHNPKAYTGVKLVREGALALSGDAGIGDVRREIEAGLRRPAGRRQLRGGRRLRRLPRARALVHRRRDGDAAEGRRRRRQRHGRPDGRPDARAASASSSTRSTGCPTASSPTTSPTRCCQENRRFIIDRVRSEGADLGIAWDGDADRCFFIDDSGEFCDGDFLCALLARAALAKKPGATILYDPRASRAVPDTVAAAGGSSALYRVGHAFFKARMREESAAFGGEVSGHYYFRDFWCADSGTIPALLVLELLSVEGRTPGRAGRRVPRPLLHLRRDQLRGRRPGGEDGGDRRALRATARDHAASTASRSTTPTGTSTSAPRTPSRCCGSTSSRSSPARTWRPNATRSSG